MSQHLITDFINRTYTFKPFNDAKIANHKVTKYQASNRQNNNSPEEVEESLHRLQPIHSKDKENEKSLKEEGKGDHIDITI